MNMQQIRTIAKTLNIKTSRLTKLKLIHAIQQSEGNFDCFGSARENVCDQTSCCWRKDCFGAAKKFNA